MRSGPSLYFSIFTLNGSILKEVTEQIDHFNTKEECPSCGALLIETLQNRTEPIKPEEKHLHKNKESYSLLPNSCSYSLSTKFQTAYQQIENYSTKFSFDISKIDSLLDLNACGCLCIIGEQKYTQLLIDRLCLHTLLPRRYSGVGLDCSKIIVIDAGNCSDVYQSVDFARQYGLEVKKVLQNILVSRVFSIYQLANIITQELPKLIQHQSAFNNNLVIISDMLHLFVNDPHIDFKEAEGLIRQMGHSIKKMSEDRLVIVSLTHSKKKYEKLLLPTFNKCIKITSDYIGNTKSSLLQIEVNNNRNIKKDRCHKLLRQTNRTCHYSTNVGVFIMFAFLVFYELDGL